MCDVDEEQAEVMRSLVTGRGSERSRERNLRESRARDALEVPDGIVILDQERPCQELALPWGNMSDSLFLSSSKL